MDKPDQPLRRQLIKGILAVAVTAGPTLGAKSAYANASKSAPPPQAAQPRRIVYRLRTRGTNACSACKKHHRRYIFKTRRDADNGRAHPGCNCPIVPQAIPNKVYRELFLASSNGVVELPRGYKMETLFA